MWNKHWFRWWIGTFRQQTIAWASVEPYLCRHFGSLRHNELTKHFSQKAHSWFFTCSHISLILVMIHLYTCSHASFSPNWYLTLYTDRGVDIPSLVPSNEIINGLADFLPSSTIDSHWIGYKRSALYCHQSVEKSAGLDLYSSSNVINDNRDICKRYRHYRTVTRSRIVMWVTGHMIWYRNIW